MVRPGGLPEPQPTFFDTLAVRIGEAGATETLTRASVG